MKKRFPAMILALALCIGLALPASAAEDTVTPVATVKADNTVVGESDHTIIVEKNGKYGAYSYDGRQLAAPTYTYARGYSSGMAAVTMEGAWETIDEYFEVTEFEGGKYGYLDEGGKLAIPMKYAKAFDFHEGRAFVRETEDGPLMMIDKTGKVIATYNNVNLWYYETVQFSEGLAIIPTQSDPTGGDVEEYLVVDTNGKTVYTQKGGYMDFVNGYHDGLVACADDGFWGTGGPCLERSFNDMTGAGYRNKVGKKVITGDYAELGAFDGGMAMVAQFDEGWTWRCGFINTSGEVVVPIKYTSYWKHPGGGYAAVPESDDEGALGAVVDKTGKFITGYNYKLIWTFDDGLCLMQDKAGGMSAIDTTGKTVLTFTGYDNGWGFVDGLAVLTNTTTKTYSVFDRAGNDVTPMTFNDFLLTDGGYIWLSNGGDYSVYRTDDLTGKKAVPTFTDVPEWCTQAVGWAAQENITTGATPTTFSPGKNCTHVQILTFLWRAEDKPESTATVFSNLAGDYAPAANWAYEKKLIGDSFDPDAACTRAQAVSYIWQVFKSPKAKDSSFSDVAADAGYAAAVNWAVENGIVEGYTDGSFRPDTICSRGVIATLLYRAYVPEARLTAK